MKARVLSGCAIALSLFTAVCRQSWWFYALAGLLSGLELTLWILERTLRRLRAERDSEE